MLIKSSTLASNRSTLIEADDGILTDQILMWARLFVCPGCVRDREVKM